MLRIATAKGKFALLKRRLGSHYRAVGALETLWHVAATNHPDGGIGRMSDEEIEACVEWDGVPGELIVALVVTRWIDRVEGEARLYVHDWHHHADETTHRKLARERRYFANGDAPNTNYLMQKERDSAESFYRSVTPTAAISRDSVDIQRDEARRSLDQVSSGQGQRAGAEKQGQEQDLQNPDIQKNTHRPPDGGVSAAGKASLSKIWKLGIEAAQLYRPTAARWELTDSRKKHVRALFTDHKSEGEEVLAKVVHGYRYARRSWEDVEQHFEVDTLLRPGNRAKYLEAYREAESLGLRPPFTKVVAGTTAPRNPAQPVRAERSAELHRLYRAGLLRESSEPAHAEWVAANRPDVRWWWLPEGERRAARPEDFAALRARNAVTPKHIETLTPEQLAEKRGDLRTQARAIGGAA